MMKRYHHWKNFWSELPGIKLVSRDIWDSHGMHYAILVTVIIFPDITVHYCGYVFLWNKLSINSEEPLPSSLLSHWTLYYFTKKRWVFKRGRIWRLKTLIVQVAIITWSSFNGWYQESSDAISNCNENECIFTFVMINCVWQLVLSDY